MSVSDAYLAATVNAAAVAKHHGVKAFINMSQMTVSQMSITELLRAAAQAALARRAGAELVRSASCARAADSVSRRLLPDFDSGFSQGIRSDQATVREGKTSPVAVEDVARVIAALLANPQPHIGKIYHLTGPQSENMHFFAQEYSKALGRTITFQDIAVEPWRDELLKRGFPVHLVNHLARWAICIARGASTGCRTTYSR